MQKWKTELRDNLAKPKSSGKGHDLKKEGKPKGSAKSGDPKKQKPVSASKTM